MKEKLQDQETVKTCPVCGDKYYKDEKFCSRECEEKFNKRKKVCAYCGNEFYPKNNIQKYLIHLYSYNLHYIICIYKYSKIFKLLL